MPLNKNQTKTLIKSVQKFRTGLDISVKDLYTIIDAYKRNIKYDTETIKWTKHPYIIQEHKERHTYQIEYPFEIESKAYLQTGTNTVTFVFLWATSPNRVIINQANTKLAKEIFLYMNKLYNSQHR